MKIILVLLLALGCSYNPYRHIDRGIKWQYDSIPGQEEAIKIVRRHVEVYSGERLHQVKPIIRWVTTSCNDGVKNTGVNYNSNCKEAVVMFTSDCLWAGLPQSAASKAIYRGNGILYDDKCFGGVTWTCSEIYVAHRASIGASSLAHELGHCYKLALMQDPDRMHIDDEFWQIIATANAQIKASGL